MHTAFHIHGIKTGALPPAQADTGENVNIVITDGKTSKNVHKHAFIDDRNTENGEDTTTWSNYRGKKFYIDHNVGVPSLIFNNVENGNVILAEEGNNYANTTREADIDTITAETDISDNLGIFDDERDSDGGDEVGIDEVINHAHNVTQKWSL